MTKYERDLQFLERELTQLPAKIRATKSRGRKVSTAQKQFKKAQTRVKMCLVVCQSLPKPWSEYKPINRKSGFAYSRQEVTRLHEEMGILSRIEQCLKDTQGMYENRFMDRQEYRKRLRDLPVEIESLKSLIEIAEKRRKPKNEKGKMAKWIEVAPGYFVEKYRIVSYCRTLPIEPEKILRDGFYILQHPGGYAKFALNSL